MRTLYRYPILTPRYDCGFEFTNDSIATLPQTIIIVLRYKVHSFFFLLQSHFQPLDLLMDVFFFFSFYLRGKHRNTPVCMQVRWVHNHVQHCMIYTSFHHFNSCSYRDYIIGYIFLRMTIFIMKCHIGLQWSPSYAATLGESRYVRIRGVAVGEGENIWDLV